MKIEGTYTFEAPRDRVWQALLDPDVLAKTLPGCEKLEKVGENDYKGALNIRIGPVQGKFQGTVTLLELSPPETYRIQVNGRGPAGFMKGDGNIRLEDQGETTLLHYGGDAQVGGRIASVGQRLIDSTAKSLTRRSLEGLQEQIKAGQVAVPTPEPQPEATEPPVLVEVASQQPSPPPPSPLPVSEAPSQTQFAVDVARDVLDDLIPAEKRATLIVAALGILVIFLLSEWWTTRLAHRVADILQRRR